MLLLLPILLLAFFAWRGGNPVGIGLIVLGFLGQLVLGLRILRSSVGGVGGHAEWVRDVSRRPGIDRNPVWLATTALIVLGAVVAAFA